VPYVNNKQKKSGVNFINVLLTNFLYERRFSSYVLPLSKNSYEKFVGKTLMKLTAEVNNLFFIFVDSFFLVWSYAAHQKAAED